MKYLRKFIAMMIGIIFFISAVICVGMIFAVKNINITLLTYEEDYTESYEQLKETLGVFKGESILFVSDEQIVAAVEDSDYTVTACRKIYPCTVNVTLKERIETFAVSVGGQYSMYDSDGKYLRTAYENVNKKDGSPNVEVTGIAVEEIGDVAQIASVFKAEFSTLRSTVVGIEIDTNPDIELYTEKLYFNLRCGLKIEIDDFSRRIDEKIKAAYEKFLTLTDRQKLGGTLRSYVYGGADGEIRSDYSAI